MDFCQRFGPEIAYCLRQRLRVQRQHHMRVRIHWPASMEVCIGSTGTIHHCAYWFRFVCVCVCEWTYFYSLKLIFIDGSFLVWRGWGKGECREKRQDEWGEDGGQGDREEGCAQHLYTETSDCALGFHILSPFPPFWIYSFHSLF